MIKININQICKIKIFEKLRCNAYYYQKKGKYFFNKKDGFYKDMCLGNDYRTTKESIEADGTLFVEGEQVFYKPHIEIYLSNQHMVIEWFNTTEELGRFVAEYLKDIPLIILHD